MHPVMVSRALFGIVLLPLQALAIDAPQWNQFSNGEYVDTANVKSEGDQVSGYVKHVAAGKPAITLYEVNCKGDQIRVHSDLPRYQTVQVQGGGTVVVQDDGFRTIVPGTREAQIETALCGIVAHQRAKESAQQEATFCERAKHDEQARIMLVPEGRLTRSEGLCLSGIAAELPRTAECDKAGVPKDATVTQYLHSKGIFLACESASAPQ